MLAISEGQYVSFAHRILWESAQRHMRIAKVSPQDSWMLHVSAGLLSAAAFEAYLNYLGQEILPQVWNKEKTFFKKRPYKGLLGKLKRISEEVGYSLPNKDCKPLSGVIEIQHLRNKIVHASPKKAHFNIKHKEGSYPKLPSMWLYEQSNQKQIISMIKDVEAFSVLLHTFIKASEFKFVIFGEHPYVGLLSSGSFMTSTALEVGFAN